MMESGNLSDCELYRDVERSGRWLERIKGKKKKKKRIKTIIGRRLHITTLKY